MNKECLHLSRQAFFDSVIEHLFLPPHEVDVLFNQSDIYFPPEQETIISAPAHGHLVIHVKPRFNNVESHFCYSILMAGDFMRINLILFGRELESALAIDTQREICSIWPGRDAAPIWRGDTLVYEWSFNLEGRDIYSNYEVQERFILGMRHMHFRLLSIFRDSMENH